jgi:hypothetical protein
MKKTHIYLINLGIFIVAAGLIFWGYQGFYNRLWSDDWCYDRDFKFLGIPKTIGLYFATGEETIRGWPLDRYAMTALSGIVYLPGVFGTQIFTAITIAIWFAVMYWSLSNLTKLNSMDVPKNILVLFSGLILYYTLYISPDRFQILYWRSGVIPYSYTLIFGLVLIGLITGQMLKKETSKLYAILAALAGLFGGGLSEIGSAFLLAGMTLLLLTAWLFKRQKREWAQRSFFIIQLAWISLFIAFAALILAPSNAARYTTMQEGPNNILLVPSWSIRSALFFITYSLKDLPLPHVVMFALFISLSMLTRATMQSQMEHKQAAWLIGLTVLVAFLLIVAIQAPTTYLYSAPPDPRGQSLSRFVMTVGIALISWALGSIFARLAPAKWTLVPALILLLGYGYTARAIRITFNDLPGFIHRAQVWDEREKEMRAAEMQGVKRMEVIMIDTHEIGTKDLMRSQDMNGKWVRSCPAGYYGMEAIKANGVK